MITRPFLSLILVCGLACHLPGNSVADEPDLSVVQKWIEAQAKVTTVTGNFEQVRTLKTVKRPLKSSGTFSFKIPGSFRWQAGDPASLIAVRKDGGDFWVLRPSKKVAERHSAESLEEDGKANAAAFLEAGFPRDFETFQKNFEVKKIQPNSNDSYMEIEVDFRDRRARTGVVKLTFYVDTREHLLRGFKLYLRDASEIFCQFSNMRTGVSIPASTFEVDTTGYEIEEKK